VTSLPDSAAERGEVFRWWQPSSVRPNVPRSWLRRNRRGLRYSVNDIPPERIKRLITFAELAGSSADERRLTA
jgi:hypothetical protein